MAQQRKKGAPKAFDVHRTLPPNATNHRPPVHHLSNHQTRRPTPTTSTPDEEPKKRRSIKRKLSYVLLFLVAVVLAFAIFIGAWDARNISAASKQMFGSSNLVALARGGSVT